VRGGEKRLLVNPFLVVMDWLLAVSILRAAFKRADSVLFEVGAVLLLLSFFLLQYHCLDCGATGWMLLRRRHACPVEVRRRRNGRPPRWGVPSVGIQIVVWCYLLVAVVLIWLILTRA
jgi:hypothetical protein